MAAAGSDVIIESDLSESNAAVIKFLSEVSEGVFLTTTIGPYYSGGSPGIAIAPPSVTVDGSNLYLAGQNVDNGNMWQNVWVTASRQIAICNENSAGYASRLKLDSNGIISKANLTVVGGAGGTADIEIWVSDATSFMDFKVAGSDVFRVAATILDVVTGYSVGLGVSSGRIKFKDEATDKINFLDCKIGIGTDTPSENADLTLEGGVLCLKEATTPIADAGKGKIYFKPDDHRAYVQDGLGVEHCLAYLTDPVTGGGTIFEDTADVQWQDDDTTFKKD